MSERYATCMTIGGSVEKDRLPELLKAFEESWVSTQWGDAQFQPGSADDLMDALRDGRLWVCNDQSRDGEFPELELACQKLGLSYARWSEGFCECDARVEEWRPGMSEPLVRVGSNHGNSTYVETAEVKKALEHLEASQLTEAADLLRSLCPDLPTIPPFQVV